MDKKISNNDISKEKETPEELFKTLMEKISLYYPLDELELVKKAYELAYDAHKTQFRKSGEPYIIHPLSVAIILSELELDKESIVAGLLHDVIEDTMCTFEEISDTYGEEVALLVDGVTKLESLTYSSLEDKQAENYRKMFMAMAKDIRVLIIKIADRVHNMRTLKHMSPDKQKEIAQETIDIYAPLADRLGMARLKDELEDLSFSYLHPEEFVELKAKIEERQEDRQAYVDLIIKEVKDAVETHGIFCEVEGRPKHYFSIYKKMKLQDRRLEEIYDIFAIRVLVETVANCYEVLGIVHELYTPVPGRFKDYIALPKSNKYQSLHNTLIGPKGEPFEIQIRTFEMHKTAEYGIAAHWRYKQGDTSGETDLEEQKLAWLRQMLEWQRDLSDNKEYLDALKTDLNVYDSSVYVFTPQGEVISLGKGSTPIDFAYSIHSDIGNMMIGAKVNNRIVPLDYKLKNGERVEVLTSKSSKGPSRDWLKIAKTSQARNKINQWFKKEYKEENIIRGRDALHTEAERLGIPFSELATPEAMQKIIERFSLKDWDTVCAAVGHGTLTEKQVINRLHDEYLKNLGTTQTTDEEIIERIEERKKPTTTVTSGVRVKGIGNVAVRFSKCCNPVPGDDITGFVTRGRGLSVHRRDCPNIVHLTEDEKLRLIDVEWNVPKSAPAEFRAELHIVSEDRSGLLVEVSRVFEEEKLFVHSINMRPTKEGITTIDVTIVVNGKEQLQRIRKEILKIPGVQSVERLVA